MVANTRNYKEKLENRGKKSKISAVFHRRILSQVRENLFVTPSALKKQYSLNVNALTIRKLLIKNNLKAKIARKVPFLTIVNIKKRYKFSGDRAEWPVSKWRNILGSDETKLNLFYSNQRSLSVRRPPNTEFFPQHNKNTIKHCDRSIMVWGASHIMEQVRYFGQRVEWMHYNTPRF